MDKERLFRYLDRKYVSKSEIAGSLPLGMNPDEIWRTVLEGRLAKAVRLPLKNVHGDNYWYVLTDNMITASETIVEELMEHPAEQELLPSSISTIEEIFFTGYMEGSQISITDAMTFLQSGQQAQDIEELMLLNNRQASSFAAQNIYHAIDEDYLHTLAYILTNGLDNGGGDFRLTDSIEIPSMRGEAFEVPSSSAIAELTAEFTQFLTDPKVHPLIKSAVSQAWVLTVRPFPEGNERLARLLSSVILIRAGYSFFSNVSLSALIARNGYSYFNAIANILRTENAADLTYFVEYYLTLLSSAVTELRTRKIQKEQEVYEAEKQMAETSLSPPNRTVARNAAEISAEEKTKPKTNKHTNKIKTAIKKFRKKGIHEFLAKEVAEEIGVSTRQTYRALEFLVDEGYIIHVGRSHAGNIYGFNEAYSNADSSTENTTLPNISETLAILNQKNKSDSENTRRIAQLLISYLQNGKKTFTSVDISDTLGIPGMAARNAIKWYKQNHLLKPLYYEENKLCHYIFSCYSEGDVSDDNENTYSPEVHDLIHQLQSSLRSTKDRRLGDILTECLPRGVVTEADYIRRGDKTKWIPDMKFAVLLGVVEQISRDTYRILPRLTNARSALVYTQKSTLSALYEFFGDDMFSVEMAVAKLDYSSAHLSGMLHQFTWLKLIDSQMNDDNTLSYHLKVNPKDDPECFLVA